MPGLLVQFSEQQEINFVWPYDTFYLDVSNFPVLANLEWVWSCAVLASFPGHSPPEEKNSRSGLGTRLVQYLSRAIQEHYRTVMSYIPGREQMWS